VLSTVTPDGMVVLLSGPFYISRLSGAFTARQKNHATVPLVFYVLLLPEACTAYLYLLEGIADTLFQFLVFSHNCQGPVELIPGVGGPAHLSQ